MSSSLIEISPQAPASMMSVSKSELRAMQCETHYAAHYLDPDSPLKLISSPLAQTGTDFHAYRAAYITHLVEEGLQADVTWATDWLNRAIVTDDARKLIADDIRSYQVNPDTVYAAELFLSIDADGDPLEQKVGGTPGQGSADPRAIARGSIDLLQIDLVPEGGIATITDYKSGWATASVSDFEPPMYAALVFAHFPQVTAVRFVWEFARLRSQKMVEYSRSEFPWMLASIQQGLARKRSIAERFQEGELLLLDPWAGLCMFCALRCPLRDLASSGRMIIPPIQTQRDAQDAAAVLYAANQLRAMAQAALKPWLAENGPMMLGQDFTVEPFERGRKTRPLPETLQLLGIDISALPEKSPVWDVPIARLTAGGLSTYAKAKKRAGMSEALAGIEKSSSTTAIRIRRLNEGEQLLESGEELGDE